MADKRHISEEYTELAKKLIDEEDDLEYIRKSDVIILYLASTHKKVSHGKKVCGQCEKVQDKNKWAIPADYTITVFEPNCQGMSEEQLKILLFHELLHIKVEDNKPAGINGHDLEDFKYIVKRFGVDWAKVEEVPDEINLT